MNTIVDIHNSENPVLSEYKDILSAEDLMSIFGVSKNTIYKEIRNGAFGIPTKIGRTYVVPKTNVLNKYFKSF